MSKLIDDVSVVAFFSYPKSGNTWLKLFFSLLSRYKLGQTDVFSLDNYKQFLPLISFSDRKWLNDFVGQDTQAYDFDTVNKFRHKAMKQLCEQEEMTYFVKGHDYCWDLKNNRKLINDHPNMKVIYIVRNPLDIAVSLSHFADLTLQTSIEFINSEHAYIPHNNQLEVLQKLKSWSQHVTSWLDAPFSDLLLIKYEDMLHNPLPTFNKICDFIHLPLSTEVLQSLVKASSFDKFHSDEKKNGFKERIVSNRSFFHKGISGQWKNVLTESKVKSICSNHMEMMKLLGYDSKEPCLET